MKRFQQQLIIGQVLGDAHLEKVRNNCRLTFSFGQTSKEYGDWLYSHLKEYCNRPVYSANVTTKGKVYENYRLKTRTDTIFTEFHSKFYKYDTVQKRYYKIVPNDIVVDPVILAHFLMGDGNSHKDGRIRIYTNNYSLSECELLRSSVLEHCKIPCEVTFDRISQKGDSQYILTFPKREQENVQNLVANYMHPTMLYRIGRSSGNKLVSPF